MNAERRKQLKKLLDTVEEVKTTLETLKDEEQDYYDNMPESLQGGEKVDKVQMAIDVMESAGNSLEEVVSYIEEATE